MKIPGNFYMLLAGFCCCLFIFSCKKTELVTITGNQAPVDTTLETVVYEDFINRTYILVLGREPNVTEFNSSLLQLQNANLNLQSRHIFLDGVFSKPDYRWRQFDKWRIELLNNMDTSDVTNTIAIFDFLLGDTTNQAFWPTIQYERDRLAVLQQAPSAYSSGSISIRELQLIMTDNYFYDQINMGSLNFVNTTFQHFLNRNPTLTEQSNGVSMVNGNNAVLFLQAGSSKEDYLDIFFNSSDYYEGAINRLYQDYLFRAPVSLEMSVASLNYQQSHDFEAVQKAILSTDEFVKGN